MILPKNIDYKQYYKTNGMATSMWGKHAWNFLFTSILGTYPIKINPINKEHLKIKESFKHLLQSLEFIMPCIFCRKSFSKFIKELPIEQFLIGRIELMYWLYLIKHKVNQKLITQEYECYNNEKKKLLSLYPLNSTKLVKKLHVLKKKTFITKPTPPFKNILDKYEKNRAICSKVAKTCILPNKN